LEKKGYWVFNAEVVKDAFDILEKGSSLRIAKKKAAIPNFEVKFAKKETDFIPLKKPIKVVVNKKGILMSPLEVQIPFKVWLGSNKDVEDAVHIYNLFKDNLDKKLMLETAKKLKVEKEMNKYGLG